MTFSYALLVVGVSAFALVGMMALLARWDKKKTSKEYDERQQAVRGKAFEWAFVIGFIYACLVMLLDVSLPEGLQASVLLIVAVGLVLEGFSAGCYCIFHDAYLPLTQSPKVNIAMLYVLGAVQLLGAVSNTRGLTIDVTESGISRISFWEVMLSGNQQSAVVWMNLMVAAMSFVLATLELVRFLRDKRNEQ